MKVPFKDIDAAAARQYIDSHAVGKYILLDVRQVWEYDEFHIPGARLIPLPDLPDRLDEVPRDQPVLAYCASGGRSAAAASLLSGQGREDVFNLAGGIMAWKGEVAAGLAETGLIRFTGAETPMDILVIAYSMESNLGRFYAHMSSWAQDADVAATFTRLVKFEEGHKARVVRVARGLDPACKGGPDLEKKRLRRVLEGGWTEESFIKENEAYLKTPSGAVEAAMMFEAQALDLYSRYADKAGSPASVKILNELAQEEKAHLQVLGRLMDGMKNPPAQNPNHQNTATP